ncbi:MAG TPA: pyridoxamine 5'-phosphate oxidase [Steroidobacteraceae bacterium]|nr:pyridoxamine 5'-phosphate oxidase [Steroidobacteraceae bacterium]
MEDPISKFNQWWSIAKNESPLKQKNAVCVSTVKEDGFPSGRFVDLKAVDENGFKFCTHFDSNKGLEIARNPRVAMTIWWDHVGFQVRIIGLAAKIPVEESTRYWMERSRSARIVALTSMQSRELRSDSNLDDRIDAMTKLHEGHDIPKPENWGGYVVSPVSIEFLTFKDTRLHVRELFSRVNDQWSTKRIQP